MNAGHAGWAGAEMGHRGKGILYPMTHQLVVHAEKQVKKYRN